MSQYGLVVRFSVQVKQKNMKFNISAIIFMFVVVLFPFMYVSSIMCYDCNSAFDPRCGEEFDPFSLGIVNCSLRDPPEHLEDPGEPTICRSIKMEIYDKVRVVRTCGYLTDENATQPCRRQTGNGDLFVTYCNCNTDLCNSSATLTGFNVLVCSFLFFLFSSCV